MTRVLIVDDSALVRKLFGRVLTAAPGFEVATREQQAMLWDYRDMREIRQTGRNARKYVLRLGRERAATEEKDYAPSSH